MRIYQSGKVGIGSTPVSAKLDVASANTTIGIHGSSLFANATQNRGLMGDAAGSTSQNIGVYAVGSITGTGVGGAIGLYGEAQGTGSQDAIGVYAVTPSGFLASTGTAYALFATSQGAATNWAGYFGNGNVHITNKISLGAAAGTFGNPGDVLTSNGNGGPAYWGPGGAAFTGPTVSTIVRTNGSGTAQEASSIYDVPGFTSIGGTIQHLSAANRFTVEAGSGAGLYGGMYINTTGTSKPFYGFLNNGSEIAWISVDPSDANKMKFFNNGALSITLDNGNVGIGTTSPPNPLSVETTSAPGTVASFKNLNSGSYSKLILDATNAGGYLSLQNNGTEKGFMYSDGTATYLGTSGGSGGDLKMYTNGNERITVQNAGNVGIGTNAPSVKLEVAGTDAMIIPSGTTAQKPVATVGAGAIRYNTDLGMLEYSDGTNWHSLVPPGTIVAYGGTTAPQGWLMCNGASYAQTAYPKLYIAIGTAYGNFGGANFLVPDLRGKFLRGVDGATANDPGAGSRVAQYTGGNGGDNVGSWQAGLAVSPGGGQEGRPVNIYVNYIIKY
jgi:hypothetical protein